MGRTKGFWEQDSAFPDGLVFIPASVGQITAGAGVFARQGLGLVGVTMVTAQTVTFDVNISHLIMRFGKQDDGLQQFGAAALTNGNQGQQSLATSGPGNTGPFATNWDQSGRPPYASASQFVVPTNRPKGIAIRAITPIYSVTGSALTSQTLGLTKTVFAEAAAPVVTALLAAAANGQPLTVNTAGQTHATTSSLLAANQVMQVARNTDLIIEHSLVIGAGTAEMYGWFVDINFNHN